MSDPKTGKMVTKIEMGDMTIGELLKKIQTNDPKVEIGKM